MERKYAEMERDFAVKGAVEWLDNAAALFERAAREMMNYRTRFKAAVVETNDNKPGSTAPVDVLSWAVNATCTPGHNLRLDMAVTHGARLASAFDKVRALKKETES